MKLVYWSAIAVIVAAGTALAQEQGVPPAGQPATVPAPPVAPPAPPVFEYSGKPIVLPVRCTEEDLTALGLSCSEDEPCPFFLDLTSIETAGPKTFVTGNLHTTAVTTYSILLTSEDNGKTWREAADRIRGAALENLQFSGQDTGWINGEKLNPLASEPFLLMTTDAGKTWKRKAIFDEDADNRLGAILQFYFSDKTSGSVVIDRGQGSDGDRYELWESPNGGDTWGIKQSNRQPIKLKRPDPEPPALRIRVDTPTRAFQIERRQGAQWAKLAAFAVQIGACKPE